MSTGGSESHGASESLLRRISDLDVQLRSATSESVKRKKLNRTLREQITTLTTQVAALTTERDRYKGQVESDDPTEVETLKAKLANRDHRDAWRDAIGSTLKDKVTIEKVWRELEYTPGDAVPSQAEIKKLVRKAKDAAPYLFRDGEDAPQDDEDSGEIESKNGSGEEPKKKRSGTSSTVQDGGDWASSRGNAGSGGGQRSVKVRKTDLQDPKWALNPVNQKMMQEARAAGTLEILDI